MKRIVYTCLALLALVAADRSALAQSASVLSTATIITPITATAIAPLAFGSITKGTTATVPPSSAAAAAVSFSGDEGDNISISLPPSLTISTTSGAGGASMTVTINRSALRVHTSNAQSTATALNASSGSATTILSTDNGGDGVASDGLGQAYLWIGGSVTPAAQQQRGSYSGTFTVSAAYSN